MKCLILTWSCHETDHRSRHLVKVDLLQHRWQIWKREFRRRWNELEKFENLVDLILYVLQPPNLSHRICHWTATEQLIRSLLSAATFSRYSQPLLSAATLRPCFSQPLLSVATLSLYFPSLLSAATLSCYSAAWKCGCGQIMPRLNYLRCTRWEDAGRVRRGGSPC